MTKTAAEVEREVEASRGELDRTVEALKEKMTPGQLFDEASRAMGGAGEQLLSKFVEQAKQNPMPLAVMGLGLAWLMASNNKPAATGAGPAFYPPTGETRSFAPSGHGHGDGLAEKVGEKAKAVGAKASEMMDGARSGLASAASSVGHAGHSASHGLKSAGTHTLHGAESAMHRAKSGFSDMLEREPLLLGALGVMVGIAIGAALPATEAENRLIGETRDNLVEKGREMAEEGLNTAAQVAGAAYGAVKEDLANPPEGADPAEQAGQVVRDAVDAARQSAQPH